MRILCGAAFAFGARILRARDADHSTRSFCVALSIAAAIPFGAFHPALAQWSTNPALNTPVCTASGAQHFPAIVSDGAGGAILAWEDSRAPGDSDVFAQRLDKLGFAQWTPQGEPLCTAAGTQFGVVAVSDGVGGAIVAWVDERNGNSDIFAQRINAAGTALWDSGGVAVIEQDAAQFLVRIATDGANGAIFSWVDSRGDDDDIFAQRLNAAGLQQWGDAGVAICVQPFFQTNAVIASDSVGGAVIGWQDFRNGTDNDVFAQRVNAAGTIQWAENGVAVVTIGNSQEIPVITGDGAGGAILAWEDYRPGFTIDVFAQRINASGNAAWTEDGVGIAQQPNDQMYISITGDGAGGAVIAWDDRRTSSNPDIFAQRVNSAGAPQWLLNGAPVAVFTGHQRIPTVISDGAGGWILSWYDSRSGASFDVFAQKLNSGGLPQWTPNGVAVCTAAGNQTVPGITTDGAGGAILGWEDPRTGAFDIFAQEINAQGQLGNPPVGAPEIAGASAGELRIASSPNPFARTTTLSYFIPSTQRVRLAIYDVTGREVARLVDATESAGSRAVSFNAATVPTGVYFCRLSAGNREVSEKLTVRK